MNLIERLTNAPDGQFFLLAGPCVIEGEEMALRIAEHLCGVTQRLGIPYVFKGSYRKANRSRLDSFTGIGDEQALRILRKVGECFDVPVVTDTNSSLPLRVQADWSTLRKDSSFRPKPCAMRCRRCAMLEVHK